MPFFETGFEGLLVFEPKVLYDERGFFFESFNQQVFEQHGIHVSFVQDNHSRSKYGVVRGLHFQAPPRAQAKLMRVIVGAALDVVVDLRKGSKTFGKSFSIELSAENKKQLFIPKGFAHGFSVLSDVAEILYKCDDFYDKASEGGILYNDPDLQINWQIEQKDMIVSSKDMNHPRFADFRSIFD